MVSTLGADDAFRMSENMHPSWYERHVLPYLVDIACGIRPVRRQRHKVVPLARGRVLEIGIGTGLNLEHYVKAKVRKVVGLDPGVGMRGLAQKRAERAGLEVELVGLSAEQIPYRDGTFDTVLVTYSLCTIPDPGAALDETRRVLKPGGQLIFCEHGLAPDMSVRRWQDRLNTVLVETGRRMSPESRYSGSAERGGVSIGGYAVHVLARASSAHLQLLGYGGSRMSGREAGQPAPNKGFQGTSPLPLRFSGPSPNLDVISRATHTHRSPRSKARPSRAQAAITPSFASVSISCA